MSDMACDQHHETFVLNMGPQHPATHGVLRVKLVMDGEYIVEAEPVLGYIHRMHEKMGENRTWGQFILAPFLTITVMPQRWSELPGSWFLSGLSISG